jgi:hypothetical protein
MEHSLSICVAGGLPNTEGSPNAEGLHSAAELIGAEGLPNGE